MNFIFVRSKDKQQIIEIGSLKNNNLQSKFEVGNDKKICLMDDDNNNNTTKKIFTIYLKNNIYFDKNCIDYLFEEDYKKSNKFYEYSSLSIDKHNNSNDIMILLNLNILYEYIRKNKKIESKEKLIDLLINNDKIINLRYGFQIDDYINKDLNVIGLDKKIKNLNLLKCQKMMINFITDLENGNININLDIRNILDIGKGIFLDIKNSKFFLNENISETLENINWGICLTRNINLILSGFLLFNHLICNLDEQNSTLIVIPFKELNFIKRKMITYEKRFHIIHKNNYNRLTLDDLKSIEFVIISYELLNHISLRKKGEIIFEYLWRRTLFCNFDYENNNKLNDEIMNKLSSNYYYYLIESSIKIDISVNNLIIRIFDRLLKIKNKEYEIREKKFKKLLNLVVRYINTENENNLIESFNNINEKIVYLDLENNEKNINFFNKSFKDIEKLNDSLYQRYKNNFIVNLETFDKFKSKRINEINKNISKLVKNRNITLNINNKKNDYQIITDINKINEWNNALEKQQNLKKFFKGIEMKKKKCPICIENIGNDKLIMTNCGHFFCFECFHHWKCNNDKCPICREEMNAKLIYDVKDIDQISYQNLSEIYSLKYLIRNIGVKYAYTLKYIMKYLKKNKKMIIVSNFHKCLKSLSDILDKFKIENEIYRKEGLFNWYNLFETKQKKIVFLEYSLFNEIKYIKERDIIIYLDPIKTISVKETIENNYNLFDQKKKCKIIKFIVRDTIEEKYNTIKIF